MSLCLGSMTNLDLIKSLVIVGTMENDEQLSIQYTHVCPHLSFLYCYVYVLVIGCWKTQLKIKIL